MVDRMIGRIFYSVFAAAMLLLAPSYAMAQDASPFDDGSEEFASSAIVSDSELDQNRGGFINVGGMLVSFSYHGLATVNGTVVATSSFNSADFAAAADTMHNLIVQNRLDNAVIAVTQSLNLEVIGGMQHLNSHVMAGMANYQALIALR